MDQTTLKQEIQRVYTLADRDGSLPELMDAICAVLQRHPQELAHLTHSYRLVSTDTGYTTTFGLTEGVFARLPEDQAVDVEVTGKEQNLLAVFQRKVAPLTALLLGRVKLKGDKSALVKLAEFL
jgi:hypothetical protein